MICIYLLSLCFFVQCIGMDMPLDKEYIGDLIPRFEASEQAAKYQPLKNVFRSQDLAQCAPDILQKHKFAFAECFAQIRPSQLNIDTLKYILDNPILVEAVLAHTSDYQYQYRNEFIQLFFFGALQWAKADAYGLLLEKNIDLLNIRSIYGQTPAEFMAMINERKS